MTFVARYESMELPLKIYISTSKVGVNAGAVDGFSHVNARPQTVGRTKKLFRNVTCSFRCCLMSVSMVFSVGAILEVDRQSPYGTNF